MTDPHASETQIAAKIFATQTANVPPPTDTPQPTATRQPTATSEPTPIPKPTATPTPVASIPPRGAYKHGYEVKDEFDRIKGYTAVHLDPRVSEEDRAPGGLGVFYTYDGTTPAPPSSVYFSFVSTADDWQYLECHDLSLLLDNQVRMPLETKHDGSVGRGYVMEFVGSYLTLPQFLQIVNAKKVEGKLCNTQFELSAEQMEALRDLASRMQP